MMVLKQNLPLGTEFENLIVDSEKYTKRNKTYVWCKCVCGKRKEIRIDWLLPKQIVKSCGCKKRYYTSKNHNIRKGSLVNLDGDKKCSSCKEVKNIVNFCKASRTKDGYSNSCNECKREGKKYYHLKKKYNLTKEEYEEICDENNICDLCKRKYFGTLHIDHCHKTGKVRGAICNSCNLGIGLLGDGSDSIKLALEYLEKFEKNLK